MNSVEKTASGVPERWYRRVANRDVFNKGCRMVEADCDEYPFYATVQGGPKAPAAGRWVDASLRSTNAVQNQYEGTILRAMTQRCTMSSAVATGENMPPLGGDAHLVVPLPELPVPTFYLCG